jgi:Raf kinase inhibitor-like YbhB/YbcL family protein
MSPVRIRPSAQVRNKNTTMQITSSAFQDNTKIPIKYTCDGDSVNPPLFFSGIPTNARSLVLIVDDPDAPMMTFVHWILFNLDPKLNGITENSVPEFASQGKTSMNEPGYVSFCPPAGIHRYFFKLYALDVVLDLKDPSKAELEAKMQSHIIDKSELIGLYSRN